MEGHHWHQTGFEYLRVLMGKLTCDNLTAGRVVPRICFGLADMQNSGVATNAHLRQIEGNRATFLCVVEVEPP